MWLIFDVGPYPLLFDVPRAMKKSEREHAVGHAELREIHAGGARGGSDTRSGWRVFEPSVRVRQTKARGDSTVLVADGTWLESSPSYDVREARIRAIPPNKAPEPTPVSVTPRATEGVSR